MAGMATLKAGPEGCSALGPRPCSGGLCGGGGGAGEGPGSKGWPRPQRGCSAPRGTPAPGEGAWLREGVPSSRPGFLFSRLAFNSLVPLSFSRTVPGWQQTQITIRWIPVSRHRSQLADTCPLSTVGAQCTRGVTVLPPNYPSAPFQLCRGLLPGLSGLHLRSQGEE